jgi:hypothetical protein
VKELNNMEDETNEIMPHTEDYQFDALANEYNEKKRHTFPICFYAVKS